MAKFAVQFIIDGSRLGDMFEVLHPLRIENYEHKLVAGTPTKIRAGDKTALEMVVMQATEKPMPADFFKQKLVDAGFGKNTVYATLRNAVVDKQLRVKKIGGRLHYYAGGK
jgi:hypothetical protein